jgi:hypothetical protein
MPSAVRGHWLHFLTGPPRRLLMLRMLWLPHHAQRGCICEASHMCAQEELGGEEASGEELPGMTPVRLLKRARPDSDAERTLLPAAELQAPQPLPAATPPSQGLPQVATACWRWLWLGQGIAYLLSAMACCCDRCRWRRLGPPAAPRPRRARRCPQPLAMLARSTLCSRPRYA